MKLLTPELLILAQMCTKSFVGPHSAPPDPLAGLRGPTSKGRGGVGRGNRVVGRSEGKGRGGKGKEGRRGYGGEGPGPPQNSGSRTAPA